MAGSGKKPRQEALKNKSMLVVRNITKQEVTNVIFPNGLTVGTYDLRNGAKIHGDCQIAGVVNARDVRIDGKSIRNSNPNILLFSLSSPIFAFDGPSDYTASPSTIVMTALQVSQSQTLRGTDIQLKDKDGTSLTSSLGSDNLAETSTGNSAYQVTTTYDHATMNGKFPLEASVTCGGVTRTATISRIEGQQADPAYTFLAWGDPAVLQVQASSNGTVSGLTSADYLQVRARRGTTGIAFNEREDGDVSSSGADTFALDVDGYGEVSAVATTESGQTFYASSEWNNSTNTLKFKDGGTYVLTLTSGFATVGGTKCSKLTVTSFVRVGETYSNDPIARIDIPVPIDANSNGTNVSDNVTLSIVKVFAGEDASPPTAIDVQVSPGHINFAGDSSGTVTGGTNQAQYRAYIRVYEDGTEIANVSTTSGQPNSTFYMGGTSNFTVTDNTSTWATGSLTRVNGTGTGNVAYVAANSVPSNFISGLVSNIPLVIKDSTGGSRNRQVAIAYTQTNAGANGSNGSDGDDGDSTVAISATYIVGKDNTSSAGDSDNDLVHPYSNKMAADDHVFLPDMLSSGNQLTPGYLINGKTLGPHVQLNGSLITYSDASSMTASTQDITIGSNDANGSVLWCPYSTAYKIKAVSGTLGVQYVGYMNGPKDTGPHSLTTDVEYSLVMYETDGNAITGTPTKVSPLAVLELAGATGRTFAAQSTTESHVVGSDFSDLNISAGRGITFGIFINNAGNGSEDFGPGFGTFQLDLSITYST